MTTYILPHFIVFSQNKALPIEREDQTIVGHLLRHQETSYEKHRSFRFESQSQQSSHTIGILDTGWKRMWLTEYLLTSNDQAWHLKEKAGNHLLYFCLDGQFDQDSIRIEENWSQQIEIKLNGTLFATIDFQSHPKGTLFEFEEPILESSPLFTLVISMALFYRVYKKEHDFIEEWLTDEWTQ